MYCRETLRAQLELWPWASVPISLHRLYCHSAEVMQRNGGFGLGLLSEEGLEALHKLLRNYRETRARKTCLRDQIEDVFLLLFLQSDPRIRASARKYTCKKCNGTGHSTWGCPLTKSQETTEDDEIVNSFFL